MWHEQTRQLVEDGKLVILGVTQEQHAERCRLFAQWHNLEFPIVHDQANTLGLDVVLVATLIDEHGIVRSLRPRRRGLAQMMAEEFDAPEQALPVVAESGSDLESIIQMVSESADNPSMQMLLGDSYLQWAPEESRAADALAAYERAGELINGSGLPARFSAALDFRKGVAWRDMHDRSDEQDPEAFAKASAAWSSALDAVPGQYIWRRRIEQYGPRLIKPYPFYDWVATANREITERGDTPIELTVALSGAEIARNSRRPEVAQPAEHPDPRGEIAVDDGSMIAVQTIAVPAVIKRGGSLRVHLEFQPSDGIKWNNESTPLRVWVENSEGAAFSANLIESVNPDEATSSERRNIEFEVYTEEGGEQELTLNAVAYYNVCDDESGVCVLKRQPIALPVTIRE